MQRVVCFILGGGHGSGLYPLTLSRSVPAVPLAGNPAEHPAKLAEVNVQWVVATDGLTSRVLPRVAEAPRQPLLQALAQRGAAGLVLFSSGTTGRPKAMVQDFRAWLATFESRRPNRLPVLALLGFDHVGGLNTLFGTLATGAALVVPPDRSVATVLAVIQAQQVVVLPATPTFLNLLLAAGATSAALASPERCSGTCTRIFSSGLTRRKSMWLTVRFTGWRCTSLMRATCVSLPSLRLSTVLKPFGPDTT